MTILGILMHLWLAKSAFCISVRRPPFFLLVLIRPPPSVVLLALLFHMSGTITFDNLHFAGFIEIGDAEKEFLNASNFKFGEEDLPVNS